MSKWIAVVGIIVVAAAVLAFKIAYPSGTWRYKMNVIVETPEGIRSGSAVREVRASREPDVLPDVAAGKAYVVGEAVTVDLGKRGVLFALLGQDEAYMIVFDAFPGPPGLTAEGIKYYRNLKDAKAVIEPGPLPNPQLVTFTDLDDPKSIQAVDPDNLAATFGEGVSLKQITIEMTNEPVTWEIGKRLSWLPDYYSKMLDGSRFQTIDSPNSFANSFSSGNLSTGGNTQ